MTEPAVALTDYFLAAEAAILAAILRRRGASSSGIRHWLALFFASVAIASLCGGTVHGFFHDEQSLGNTILWAATMLAIGVTAASTWAIGAELLASERWAGAVRIAALAQLAVYSVVVVLFTSAFWVAILMTLPASLFLLLVAAIGGRGARRRPRRLLAAGVTLNLVAGALQQLRVGMPGEHFDHNVLYHVLQAMVLGLLFLGGLRLVGESSPGA
ncbi:MAG TPA: hypothetical protein VF175_05210 [Lacipirellula sp.]